MFTFYIICLESCVSDSVPADDSLLSSGEAAVRVGNFETPRRTKLMSILGD